MANYSGSLHFHAQQQSVAVTIRVGRDNPQPIPRGFAFHPQLLARPAEKRHVPFLQRTLERLTIHEAHHQNLAISGVLHHGGKQAAQFVEVKFCIHTHNSSLGETKSPLSVVASAGRNS